MLAILLSAGILGGGSPDAATEPVTLAEARLQCRIIDPADTEQDPLLNLYISAARRWVENYTGQTLVARELVEAQDAFCSTVTIYSWPVQSVAITYRDTAGATQVVNDARIVSAQRPVRLAPANGASWPVTERGYGAVTYTVQAGYPTPDQVPQDLKHAVLLLVAHWFAHREAIEKDSVSEVPLGARALCDPYRLVML